VGFSHKLDYAGVAVLDADGYRTPLGVLTIDEGLTKKIVSFNEKFLSNEEAFKSENSIELILPFIQVTCPKAKAVLLAIGNQSLENAELIGRALYELLRGRKNILLIASTDMSHYLSYSQAQKVDSQSAGLIAQFKPRELFLECSGKNRMCGAGAVTAVMIASKKLGADKVYKLNESSSGDIAGDKRRVVGYLSAAFVKENNKESEKMDGFLNVQQKEELLKIARDAITSYLRDEKVLDVEASDTKLEEVMGVFVTLHEKGELRGCIGNIIGTEPLYLGVRDMAIASATQDPRFTPVTESELKEIDIEISVLSPLEKITDTGKIIVGKHGVLVKDGYRSGVYLPQVATEMGWDRQDFMNSLCGHKAGMATDAWEKGKCDIYVFSAEVFGEKDLR